MKVWVNNVLFTQDYLDLGLGSAQKSGAFLDSGQNNVNGAQQKWDQLRHIGHWHSDRDADGTLVIIEPLLFGLV